MYRSSWRGGVAPPSAPSFSSSPPYGHAKASPSSHDDEPLMMDTTTSPSSAAHQFPSPSSSAHHQSLEHSSSSNNNNNNNNLKNPMVSSLSRKRHSTMSSSPSTPLYASNDPYGWPDEQEEEEEEDANNNNQAAAAEQSPHHYHASEQEELVEHHHHHHHERRNPPPPAPASPMDTAPPGTSPTSTTGSSVTSNAMSFWKQRELGGGGTSTITTTTTKTIGIAPNPARSNNGGGTSSSSSNNHRHSGIQHHNGGGAPSLPAISQQHYVGGEDKSQTSQSHTTSSSYNPYSYASSLSQNGGMKSKSTTTTSAVPTSAPTQPSWVKNVSQRQKWNGGNQQYQHEESMEPKEVTRKRSSPSRRTNNTTTSRAPPIPRTISSDPPPSNHHYHPSSSTSSPRNYLNQNKSTTSTVFQKLSTMMQGPQTASSNREQQFQDIPSHHQDPIDDTPPNHNVGEMQIQLDIAAAQLLTNEMKTKDLQQQLESEQKGWGEAMDFYQREMDSLKERLESQEEELAQERTHSSQLRLQLDDSKRQVIQMKEQQRYPPTSSATAEELAKHVELGLQQEEEMKELYMEIDRLHESNKAERSLLLNQKKIVEDEKEMLKKQFEDCREELNGVKNEVNTLRQEKSVDDFATVESQNMKDAKYDDLKIELKNTRKDLLNINLDFRELAEEIERLEKELEAVTEDRDELLRRSVLYHKQNINKGKNDRVSSEESEVEKLRAAMQAQNERCRQKDVKIDELEMMVSKSKAFDLDLSSIDVADFGSFAMESSSRDEQLVRVLRDRDFLQTEIEETKKECDKLKICLSDAMNEIEEMQGNEKSLKQLQIQKDATEKRLKELNSIIKEQDEEIVQLKDMTKNMSSTDISTDALREELNNVVEWLNSSNRIEGDPSIECRIKDPPKTISGNFISADDDPTVQALYRHVKTMQMKLLSTQAELNLMKYDSEEDIENILQSEGTADSMEALASKEADLTVKSIRRELETTRKEVGKRQVTNEELRQSLRDALALIKPMKDHINRTDHEKEQLQTELSTTIKHLKELEERSKGQHLLSPVRQGFEQMPTPQKSNRTSEKDQNTSYDESQGMESQLQRLKNELEKKTASEEKLLAEINKIENRGEGEIFNVSSPTNQAKVHSLTKEVAVAKADLKCSKKAAKKLRKSLEEAVGMMNAFRDHVETAEKERKRLKRKVKEEQQKNLDTSNISQVDGICDDGDPDRMENTSTILHLKSHIIEMEHEIRVLEDRIAEMEAMKTESGGKSDFVANDTNELKRLEEKLQESERAYEITKKMLNDVSNVNKELLQDLKQTEVECGESIEECDILKQKLMAALEEIDNSKYVASSSLRKIEEMTSQNGSRRISASGDKKPLTELIGNLEMHINSLLAASFDRSGRGEEVYAVKSVRVRNGQINH